MGNMNEALARVRHRLTVPDFHKMGEAGILRATDRVELIEGEIVDMAPIGHPHAYVVNRLAQLFSRAAQDDCLVSVQNPVRLDDHSEPQPDIALLKPGDYMDRAPQPPDILLLVEVADTSIAYDRGVKVDLYARNGVCELWLLDLGGGVLTVYREPEAGRYRKVWEPVAGEVVSPLALPGVGWVVKEGKTWSVPF